jgi:hypothetical protein
MNSLELDHLISISRSLLMSMLLLLVLPALVLADAPITSAPGYMDLSPSPCASIWFSEYFADGPCQEPTPLSGSEFVRCVCNTAASSSVSSDWVSGASQIILCGTSTYDITSVVSEYLSVFGAFCSVNAAALVTTAGSGNKLSRPRTYFACFLLTSCG